MSNKAQPANGSRTTTFHGLNHLRAFAITIVFLYHYRMFGHPAWVDTIAGFGWTGVDLFFVLSGYLIAFSAIINSNNISIIEFYIKRFFRIIPAYLFIVALYFLFPAFHEKEALAPLWKYLSFTQNFNLDLRYHGTFSHAWSLCIEEQFYFILPLVIIAGIRFKLKNQLVYLLPFLFLLGFMVRYYCYTRYVLPLGDGAAIAWYKIVYYPTYSRLDGLLVGISIAAIFQFKPTINAVFITYGNLFLLTGMALLAGAYFICEDQVSLMATVIGFPLIALAYGAIVVSAISPLGILYKRKSFITSNLATLSYAIYLSHKIVIHVLQQQAGKWNIDINGNRMLFFCVLAAIAMAVVIRYLIEIPFLKMRDVLLQKRRNRMLLNTIY